MVKSKSKGCKAGMKCGDGGKSYKKTAAKGKRVIKKTAKKTTPSTTTTKKVSAGPKFRYKKGGPVKRKTTRKKK